ncbi:hypothetical protein [Streptomyces johnsoniae]|uniref:N-acetyltransferase domain-containing protein n=1 Tax=Streptomyces johnsoniae TaxID=3075532 RepID=A0ABU2SE62_9ACTN|nr:hypothetical protein [Streptomyces sp. DSM 41886]MDT0446390.1 hypothetical protein [Streptomyces sp. DSM 41886]
MSDSAHPVGITGAAHASPDYLAAAAEAELLHRLHGQCFVADEQHDPLLDERRLLVEFCAESILKDATRLAEALRIAGAGNRAARPILVRAPAHVTLAEPWHRHVTYLRHTGGPADASPEDPARHRQAPLAVRPAAPATDEAAIARWLVKALIDGSAGHGVAADPATADAVARDIIEAPDRVSFVATQGDGPAIGHLTLLGEAHDPVTGRDYIDLVDVLVEGDAGARRAGTAALTAAAIAHARNARLPLIGNVIHPAPHLAAGHGDRVVASLVARGWEVDHVFWRRPAGPDDT